MTPDPPSFEEAVALLRSASSLEYEEGYHALQGSFLVENLDKIIHLMTEEVDPEIRGRFVELLGDSKQARVLYLLELELSHPHQCVRHWALHALTYLGLPEAEELVQTHLRKRPGDAT